MPNDIPDRYQLRVRGQLDLKLAAWLGDFVIAYTSDGDTLLTGTIIDQAALHGVLARCRDLGIPLISINPVTPDSTGHSQTNHNKETAMPVLTVDVSRVIDASPADVSAVIRDYRVGHNAILPRPYFQEMIVEEGGNGAGTKIRLRMKVMGQEYHYHQVVSEPEPGRLIMETDINTGLSSRFIFKPLNNGTQTHMTISVEFNQSAGLWGVFEKLMTPVIARRIFNQELANLADYVRTHAAGQQPVTSHG